MAGNINVPLNIEDPVVLRRLLVEIVSKLNKPEKLDLVPSPTYDSSNLTIIVDKINEIIDKN